MALLSKLIVEQIAVEIASVFKAASVTSADGGRTLNATFGGVSHEVKTAIPLDAGVWVEGRKYLPGDMVSHAGSMTIARVETDERPGKSDHWRLAVRKGADGRDYRPEEKRNGEPVRFK